LLTDNEFTKILGWPGYRVYYYEIDEKAKTLYNDPIRATTAAVKAFKTGI
jgi:hypothetical protein